MIQTIVSPVNKLRKNILFILGLFFKPLNNKYWL